MEDKKKRGESALSLRVLICNEYNIIEMPFYRNLGAILFQNEIEGFQIFRAEPDTTIFQSKQQQTNATLETLAECYQIYLHNHNIHCYQQDQKGAALVVPQSKQAYLSKASIDDLCRALLEAVKITNSISSYFPTLIGDFTASQLYNINGRLAFIYLPIKQVNGNDKIDLELVKGILKLGAQLKDETNLSHRLLLKKLSKCKTLNDLSEQIHYFYSVYGVGSKSTNKPILQKREQRMQPLKKRDNKRKLNLFNMSILRNKSSKGNISCYSNSVHSSSAPKRNNSLNITLPEKGRMSNRNISNSCSVRQSPFDSLKFKTINFNSSFHSSEGKQNEESTGKKSLRKSKPNVCESIHTPVSLVDQQKLIKKLHTKKTESSTKKIESMASQKEISIVAKSEKQVTISKIMKESSIKQLQSPPKLQCAQINAVSVKFPSKQNLEPMELNIESRMNSSKTIHKHQSIHVSQTAIQSNNSNQYLPQGVNQTVTQQQVQQSKPQPIIQVPQPQVKKLKKKPIVRQQEWGSELQIVDFAKKPKEKQVVEPKIQAKQPEIIKQTKQPIKVPKISIESQSNDPQQGQQTRKNSYKSKTGGQQTVRTNTKYQQLLQKKQNFDYMGKTVVNTSGYLKNYQKIFWQLPLFFIYRAFYIMRIKLARQVQVLNQPEAFKVLVLENDQIGQAVNKLIKVVTRKLRKSDPQMLKEIKDYLNIDEKINCDGPMKSLLGEYIQSLTDASVQYPQLMKHEIEVVNSYLIAKGQKLGQLIEEKLQTQSERRAYLNDQLAKLQPFL